MSASSAAEAMGGRLSGEFLPGAPFEGVPGVEGVPGGPELVGGDPMIGAGPALAEGAPNLSTSEGWYALHRQNYPDWTGVPAGEIVAAQAAVEESGDLPVRPLRLDELPRWDDGSFIEPVATERHPLVPALQEHADTEGGWTTRIRTLDARGDDLSPVVEEVGMRKTLGAITRVPSLEELLAGERNFPEVPGNLPPYLLDRWQTQSVNQSYLEHHGAQFAGQWAAAKPDTALGAALGAGVGVPAAVTVGVLTAKAGVGVATAGLAGFGAGVGAGLLAGVAPFVTGRAIGRWFKQRAEIDNPRLVEDAGKRVAYLALGRIAAVASGIVEGAILGGVTGAIVGNVPGAIIGGIAGAVIGGVGSYFGYDRGKKLYDTERAKQHGAAVLAKAVADYKGQPEKITAAMIDGYQSSAFEPGSPLHKDKIAAEEAVRGPMLRGLGATAIALAGAFGIEAGLGALNVTGGVSLLGGAVTVGAGLVFGGAVVAGYKIHRHVERQEAKGNRKWAATARWLGRVGVSALTGFGGFMIGNVVGGPVVGGIVGAAAGVGVGAAGYLVGERIATGQIQREEQLKDAPKEQTASAAALAATQGGARPTDPDAALRERVADEHNDPQLSAVQV